VFVENEFAQCDLYVGGEVTGTYEVFYFQ